MTDDSLSDRQARVIEHPQARRQNWLLRAGDDCPDCHRGEVLVGGTLRTCTTCDGLGKVPPGGGDDDV